MGGGAGSFLLLRFGVLRARLGVQAGLELALELALVRVHLAQGCAQAAVDGGIETEVRDPEHLDEARPRPEPGDRARLVVELHDRSVARFECAEPERQPLHGATIACLDPVRNASAR